jgi:hypothetical protein
MNMKKLMAFVMVMVLILASMVMAEKPVTGEVTFDTGSKVHLDGQIIIGGTVLTATAAELNANIGTKTATAVTNAVLTLSPAAITATAAITRQTYVPAFILADGTTNTIAQMTNATAVVTVANGGVVITNVTITLSR